VDRITELVERTSRTFALGIRQLPRSLDHAISVAYLLLRVSDYFEDNERMPPKEKVRYLNTWAEALGTAPGARPSFQGPATFDDSTPDAHAAREAELILAAYHALPAQERDIIGRHVIDSTHGMAHWVERGPSFQTEADLDDYMFEVAGRVGLMLTEVFAMRSSQIASRRAAMSDLGVEFGLGLQTVNVIRGLSSDPARGWIYLPRDFLPDSVDPASLWSDPNAPGALALLDRLASKARRHLGAARDYVLAIPRREYRIRVFCILPLLFALRTLELSRANPDVYTREVKLTRTDVRVIGRWTRLLAASNAWVRRSVGRSGPS
jgi:farnesyl-diphosphate farnesyltransferase